MIHTLNKRENDMSRITCSDCATMENIRLDEFNFLSNLGDLQQQDKISSWEFVEIVKEYSGYSRCPDYIKEDIIKRGIDINSY